MLEQKKPEDKNQEGLELVELDPSATPDEIINTTRRKAGKVLIAIGLTIAGMLLLAFALSGCADNNDSGRVEQIRQALGGQVIALCTVKGLPGVPPSVEFNNIKTDGDTNVPSVVTGPFDNIPSISKKHVWKDYVFEDEHTVGQGGYISVYKYTGSPEKGEPICQLQNVTSIGMMTPEGYIVSDHKVYQLQEIGGGVQDILIGDLAAIYGPTTYKDGYFLKNYLDPGSVEKLAAIDPSNPSQILKDIVIPSNQSGIGATGIDYEDGTLAVAIETGVKIYKNLPEGIDWMDNANDYLEQQIDIGFDAFDVYVINGHIFARGYGGILAVVSPTGQVHTLTEADMNGSVWQSSEKIEGYLHVVAMPAFTISTEPNPSNPAFPYKIYPDPGVNNSNYSYCTEMTPELYASIQPLINPEPNPEEDMDVIEDTGVEIWDPVDVAEDVPPELIEEVLEDVPPELSEDIPDVPGDIPQDLPEDADAEQDKTSEDQEDGFVLPDLPKPEDVQPDVPKDVQDVQPDVPPDLNPADLDAEDIEPFDLIQDAFDKLDQLAELPYGDSDAGTDDAKDETEEENDELGETAEAKEEAPPPEYTPEPAIEEGSAPRPAPGCGPCSTSDGKNAPSSEEKAGGVLVFLLAFVSERVARTLSRRRKEDEDSMAKAA